MRQFSEKKSVKQITKYGNKTGRAQPISEKNQQLMTINIA